MHEVLEIPVIPLNAVQHETDHTADLLRRTPFALCQIQIDCPGFSAASPRKIKTIVLMESVDDFFKLLPRFVQEGKILREADIGRSTGCIKNQSATIGAIGVIDVIGTVGIMF